jgi:hypothetical protein
MDFISETTTTASALLLPPPAPVDVYRGLDDAAQTEWLRERLARASTPDAMARNNSTRDLLRDYVDNVRTATDVDGAPVVAFPDNFDVVVGMMGRAELGWTEEDKEDKEEGGVNKSEIEEDTKKNTHKNSSSRSRRRQGSARGGSGDRSRGSSSSSSSKKANHDGTKVRHIST